MDSKFVGAPEGNTNAMKGSGIAKPVSLRFSPEDQAAIAGIMELTQSDKPADKRNKTKAVTEAVHFYLNYLKNRTI